MLANPLGDDAAVAAAVGTLKPAPASRPAQPPPSHGHHRKPGGVAGKPIRNGERQGHGRDERRPGAENRANRGEARVWSNQPRGETSARPGNRRPGGAFNRGG